jgi:hypothetical protein
MTDPVISISGGHPMACDPHMAAADPTPISAGPHVAGWHNADNFNPRLRRCDHDDAPGIVTLIGDHHACGQRRSDDESEYRGCE